ncbi:MAG: ATP-grasp domain-containing protein [Deltaproteobacteria bacterium]|nr:ATP-grasp domain-containing protein [Deltaproteobacteria bacterium]
MKPQKVPILFYQPPADPEDPVVGQIFEALQALGHKPTRFAIERDVRSLLNGISRGRPDLVFNICETFANRNIFEVNVAAFLELLDVPFTGSGTAGLLLAQDKAIAKKLFTFHRVPCPDFIVFHLENLDLGGRQLRFPLFVKPLRADASIGITPESLVRDVGQLLERVRYVHSLGEAAIAEEYLEGREMYVGVLGGESRPMALPVVELQFRGGYPKGRPRIADYTSKFEKDSPEFKGTRSVVARVSAELRERLQTLAVDAFEALQLRDYARVDFRIDANGNPFVLEVNPNPYLEQSAEFAMAAKAAGMEYPQLVERILKLSALRAPKKTTEEPESQPAPPTPAAPQSAGAAG